jgi:phosphatidylethanolamine/phosphatidyl-N-methylethanolamine N-methyltransferase
LTGLFAFVTFCLCMEKDEIRKIYGRYSPVYDAIFARWFYPRIQKGIEGLRIRKGERILEVGVGTGLSLPLYPDSCKVVGIDITRKMLRKAKDKKDHYGLNHVDLVEMDAENLTFGDNSFDHAVVPFVVSVVPNPERMMSEIKRVVKKDGRIVIINHFVSNNSLLRSTERLCSPLFLKLGWRSGLTLDLLSNHCGLNFEEVLKISRLDPWFIIRAINKK